MFVIKVNSAKSTIAAHNTKADKSVIAFRIVGGVFFIGSFNKCLAIKTFVNFLQMLVLWHLDQIPTAKMADLHAKVKNCQVFVR